MCDIGEPVRTVVVDPIQVPAPLPGCPESEPDPFAEPAPCVPEPAYADDEPVLVPVGEYL